MTQNVNRVLIHGLAGWLLLASGACSSSMAQSGPSETGGASANGGASGTGGAAGTGGASGVPTDGAAGLVFPDAPLSTFTSASKGLKIELRTSPAQPIRVGPGSEGELRVVDASTGAPVDGLTITVTSWMPVMGHMCSPVGIKVHALGGGVYSLSPLDASMPGKCELKLKLTALRPDGGTAQADTATSPTFDVTQ